MAYNRPLSSKEVEALYSVGMSPVTTDFFGSGTNQFSIDFVDVGNAGNSNDTTGYGGVPYGYRIGKYEISQNQVDAAVRNGLQHVTAGAWRGDQPAGNISWYEAAAYVNWLNTSLGYQPAYNLAFSNGAWNMALWPTTPDTNGNAAWTRGGTNLFRNANCAYYLPSENEWYKAAYYDANKNGGSGGYWLYPTGTNSAPTPVASGAAAGTAVYNGITSSPASVYQAGGLSPYGTLGQGGNAWEWEESAWDGTNSTGSENRVIRGGYWGNLAGSLQSSLRNLGDGPTGKSSGGGFRVASIDDSWLTNGLVAYYPFDGDAKDYSGNGRDLTLRNSNSVSYSLGSDGTSLYLAGDNRADYLPPSRSSSNLLTNYSYSMWINPTSINRNWPEWTYLMSDWQGNGTLRFGDNTNSGTSYYNYQQFGYATIPEFLANQWQHLVITQRGSLWSLYFNGCLKASHEGSVQPFALDGFFLFNSGGYQYGYQGYVNEVRIYNRTLTSNEVVALYQYDGGVITPPTPTPQSITFPALAPVTYGVPPFTLSATASSGLPVSFNSTSTNISIAGSTVTVLGTGTATIVASQAGDYTYAAATPVTNTLVVTGPAAGLKSQTITFAPLKPKSWTNAPFALTAKATSKLPITYTSSDPTVATVSGGILTPVGVGTTTITAYQGGNTIYNPATPVSQPQVITQAGQNISFPKIAAHVYGDAPFTLNASSSSGLPITYSSSASNVATVSSNVVTIVGAGKTTITASQAGNALYAAGKAVSQNLTVAKANQTVTFNPSTPVTYTNGGIVNFNGTASSGLPLTYKSSASKVITVLSGVPQGVMIGRGTTTITASQAGDANYNKASATNTITLQ